MKVAARSTLVKLRVTVAEATSETATHAITIAALASAVSEAIHAIGAPLDGTRSIALEGAQGLAGILEDKCKALALYAVHVAARAEAVDERVDGARKAVKS